MDTILISPTVMRVHPDFKPLILQGIKCAFMCQANFFESQESAVMLNTSMEAPFIKDHEFVFESFDLSQPEHLRQYTPFAKAIARAVAHLQIDVREETITRFVPYAPGALQGKRVKLSKEAVTKVIFNEGFGRMHGGHIYTDSFWHFIQTNYKQGKIETNQIYFDELKPIN